MGDVVRMFQGQNVLDDAVSTEVLAFAKYPDLEKAADRTAAKIKEGFMEMGYILKVARDTDILAGSGYMNHEEFAEKRYGLDKGTVSRYIRIVERFSVGGNSHMLQEGYKNIGFAKLSLMLHMPDAIAEEITESYSKQEVQAIKEEIDAERAVSDIEVAIEDAGIPEEKKTGSLLERAVRQLGKEQPDIYKKLYGVSQKETGLLPALLEILAPQGEAIYMVRIPGTGRLMLSVSGEAASVTNVRSGEKERYIPEQIRNAVMGILHGDSAEESWQQEYGEFPETVRESFPEQEEKDRKEAEEVAPVQPKEKRKESKVVKATPPKVSAKKKEIAGENSKIVNSVPQETEEPLPGQMKVTDYPEAWTLGDVEAESSNPADQIPNVHYEEISEKPFPGVLSLKTGGEKTVWTEDVSVYIGAETAWATTEVEIFAKEPGTATGAENAVPAMESELLAREKNAASVGVQSEMQAPREESRFGETGESGEDIRMEAERHLESLRKYFAVWEEPIPAEYLEKAHHAAVGLAAAIEKMMKL